MDFDTMGQEFGEAALNAEGAAFADDIVFQMNLPPQPTLIGSSQKIWQGADVDFGRTPNFIKTITLPEVDINGVGGYPGPSAPSSALSGMGLSGSIYDYLPSSETLQTGLGVAGWIPGVQTFAGVAESGVALYRGDYLGAGLAAASAIPLAGYVVKGGKALRTVVWTHHIIPAQLFKELNLAKYGFNLDHMKNLVDLPFPFHANHPSYTNYVRRKISNLEAVTLENLIDIQTKMSKQIKRIHSTGASKLNQYYKDLGL